MEKLDMLVGRECQVENKLSNNCFVKENNETIGFVLACAFSSAINLGEIRKWAVDVIDRNEVDDIPDYIFELVDFNDSLAKIYSLIGFVPSWKGTEEEEKAIEGIAYKRGINIYDMSFSEEEALICLNENLQILETFKNIFPFIEFDD